MLTLRTGTNHNNKMMFIGSERERRGHMYCQTGPRQMFNGSSSYFPNPASISATNPKNIPVDHYTKPWTKKELKSLKKTAKVLNKTHKSWTSIYIIPEAEGLFGRTWQECAARWNNYDKLELSKTQHNNLAKLVIEHEERDWKTIARQVGSIKRNGSTIKNSQATPYSCFVQHRRLTKLKELEDDKRCRKKQKINNQKPTSSNIRKKQKIASQQLRIATEDAERAKIKAKKKADQAAKAAAQERKIASAAAERDIARVARQADANQVPVEANAALAKEAQADVAAVDAARLKTERAMQTAKKTAQIAHTKKKLAQQLAAIPKSHWSINEIQFLKQAVQQYGQCDWVQVSESLGTKTASQCRKQWKVAVQDSIDQMNQLVDVDMTWQVDENRALLLAVQAYGVKKWKKVEECIKTRTAMECEQQWYKKVKNGVSKSSDDDDEEEEEEEEGEGDDCKMGISM